MINTAAVAVLMPEQAVPSLSVAHFPSFPSQPEGPRTGIAPKPDPRVVAITTLRPDLATKNNPNKQRSSTEREEERRRNRLTARPPRLQSPSFHPIPPQPPGPALVPQARPNVPESENQDPRGIRGRGNKQDGLLDSWTPESDKVRILSNDNNGNFLLEENLNNKGEIPFKRNFIPESKQPSTVRPSKPAATTLITVNPALTKKPRTWPASLKKSTVSVMERSKNGEKTPEVDDRRIFESTTFSTSEVHVMASTTASPRSLEQMIRMMEQKMLEEKEKLREANVDQGLKIAKGEKLLTAIRAKVAAREQTDDEDMTGGNWGESLMATNRDKSPNSLDLQSASSDLELGTSETEKKKGRFKNEEKAIEARKMARLRARRRKLTQRAKALAKALGDITEDEPYVVFPMDNVNTKEKSVDEIFGSNPGLKRISAYDFEAAMAEKEEQATEAALPISELKSSIDGLADTMSKLSSTVHETTTKKDTASEVKINQLQEEIAKLTETLASLKIAPTPAPTTFPTQTMNSLNVVSSTTRRMRRPTKPAKTDDIRYWFRLSPDCDLDLCPQI